MPDRLPHPVLLMNAEQDRPEIPAKARIAKAVRVPVAAAAILALANCTIVTGDAATGQIAVYTLMTSRKDVTIEHHPDGTAVWRATESAADTSAATTALNLSAALARAAGAPVAP